MIILGKCNLPYYIIPEALFVQQNPLWILSFKHTQSMDTLDHKHKNCSVSKLFLSSLGLLVWFVILLCCLGDVISLCNIVLEFSVSTSRIQHSALQITHSATEKSFPPMNNISIFPQVVGVPVISSVFPISRWWRHLEWRSQILNPAAKLRSYENHQTELRKTSVFKSIQNGSHKTNLKIPDGW